MITGTVTDQTPNAALKGTPAVSDADQGIWMEYMIQHNVVKPTNVKGVPVPIDGIDPNGNSSSHRQTSQATKTASSATCTHQTFQAPTRSQQPSQDHKHTVHHQQEQP